MAHTTEEKIDSAADPEEVLAHKSAIAERLIRDQDAIIESELRRYDQAAFYIRLQSECFNLYPVLTHLLGRLINDPQKRTIFAWIVNGKDLAELAKRYRSSPEQIGITFRETVERLSRHAMEILETDRKLESLQLNYGRLTEEHRQLNHRNFSLQGQNSALKEKLKRLEARLQRETRKQEEWRNGQKQALEEMRKLRGEKWMLETRLEGLTHVGQGLWGRIKWLWSGL